MSRTINKMKYRKEKGEIVAYSEGAVRHNLGLLEYCRTSMAALSGSTAGILGLTGLSGFAFYFINAVVLWLFLLAKAGSDWQKFFRSRTQLLTSGFFGGLITYILFWTFLYGMVHVYWYLHVLTLSFKFLIMKMYIIYISLSRRQLCVKSYLQFCINCFSYNLI